MHWYDACDVEGSIADDCPDTNATCVDLTATTAECQCTTNWEGDDCDVCPGNWDAAADCDACLGNWDAADDCESCLYGWSCPATTGHSVVP